MQKREKKKLLKLNGTYYNTKNVRSIIILYNYHDFCLYNISKTRIVLWIKNWWQVLVMRVSKPKYINDD